MSITTNNPISNYLSLIKFSHTIFALPFAIIGFFLATTYNHYTFSFKLFFLVILCMVFARSAAMAFNRFIDRKYDELNKRTIIREIPAGNPWIYACRYRHDVVGGVLGR